jgi:2-oxoisovalerate dehydrogenase E1 component
MTLERLRKTFTRYREALPSEPESPAARESDPTARAGASSPAAPWTDRTTALELLESMLLARHIDRAALELRAEGVGLYTITSAGHESDAVLGRVTRPSDPALLHYRSTACFLERARQVPSFDAVSAVVSSLVGAANEPASGGRHKVLGSRDLGVIPQTSTVSSHLPRAVGLADGLERRTNDRTLSPPRRPSDLRPDSIVVASFGDASVNHSTWLGAVNLASWLVEQNRRVPLLLVCEDNGLGISVRSPAGWVERRLRSQPHFAYFQAPGTDLAGALAEAQRAAEYCRHERRPAFLHLSVVRLLAHAGTDVDTAYRTAAELEAAEAADPILNAVQGLGGRGWLTREALLALDGAAAARVDRAADSARNAPRIGSLPQLAAPLAGAQPSDWQRWAAVPEQQRADAEPAPPSRLTDLTLARGINAALEAELRALPDVVLLGEDVGVKGGVHGVTLGLAQRFGSERVRDTLLDEQSVFGLALGASLVGFLPVPEIQYLAFLHNAEDQLRGEAATLPFFSRGEFTNPMLVRIAGLGDPRGHGGHFHNDNSLAVLRDLPGVPLAVPARADDAFELYRAAFQLARREQRVIVMIEPLALYHERDLWEPGDRAWLAGDTGKTAEVGRARVYEPAAPDLTLVAYARGVRVALRAARRLEREHGIRARVLDLRWLAPLPAPDVLHHAQATGTLLVVDDARKSGGVSEALAALVLDSEAPVRFARVTAADCWIPIGPAAAHALPSEDAVVERGVLLHRSARGHVTSSA